MVNHPNGITESLTGTTDVNGAGTLAIIPQGTGTLTATVTQTVVVATLVTSIA